MASSEYEAILIDAPLAPDPDPLEELGPADPEAIADEELKGCRLLLVLRAVEPVRIGSTPGGALELTCTFHPAPGCRFTTATMLLRLTSPGGVRIADLAPQEVKEAEPVRFTVDDRGKLGVKYSPLEAGAESGSRLEYAVYHCSVQGSGAGTALARWDFTENEHRKDGISREQVLALTLPVTGRGAGTITLAARVARPGLGGQWEAIRDLVLGPDQRHYDLAFEIPEAPHSAGLLGRFLRRD